MRPSIDHVSPLAFGLIVLAAIALLSESATASDTDLPAQDLTFSLAEAPAGATIDPDTGAFAWTPTVAGDYEFAIVVTDDGIDALSTSETIAVTVTDP